MAATHELWCMWSRVCPESEFKKTWYFDTNCNVYDENFSLTFKLRRHIRSGPLKPALATCILVVVIVYESFISHVSCVLMFLLVRLYFYTGVFIYVVYEKVTYFVMGQLLGILLTLLGMSCQKLFLKSFNWGIIQKWSSPVLKILLSKPINKFI